VEFSPVGGDELAIAMAVQSAEKPPLPDVTSPLLLSALHGGDADHAEGQPRITRMGTDKKTSGLTPAPPSETIRDIRVIRGQNPSHPGDGKIRSDITSPLMLAEATQHALAAVCEKIRTDKIGDEAALADWLVRKLDLFAPAGSPARRQLTEAAQPLVAQQTEITAKIRPNSQTAPAMFEGSGVNEYLLVRGQAKAPAAMVPRGFLEAVAGPNQPEPRNGSGRLELAQRITDPANPLTARVIVNRVWHHLFGRGIVPTTDNLGVLGQSPSHPELLDHLATRFVKEQGWSVKKLIRELVLSLMPQPSRPIRKISCCTAQTCAALKVRPFATRCSQSRAGSIRSPAARPCQCSSAHSWMAAASRAAAARSTATDAAASTPRCDAISSRP
jgi:hypothetical protein